MGQNGPIWAVFREFLRRRVRNGLKTWSSVVCTHTDHLLSTVCAFAPSGWRMNFSGGLLACLLVVVVACDDYPVRRTLIIIIITTAGTAGSRLKSFCPSPSFLLPSSLSLVRSSYSLPFFSHLGPQNFGRVESAPPTSRLRTSGLGVRRRKKWSKSKTGRVFVTATKTGLIILSEGLQLLGL